MKFEEYELRRWSQYAEYGETVASILRSAIGMAGDYRLQQVRSRAKDAESLRKKLQKRSHEKGVDLVAAEDLEEEIKDLAGCRIIFYTNSDVTKLINSRLIDDNFEILEAKLHHPLRETDDAAELYTSNHYVVSLRDDRLKLPEYSSYVGMRCEIQVQTILNHAWAEMAHDTIYKEPELEYFGTKALDAIKSRMAKIARKYLVPAGYEFGKVAADFERLIKGEALFKGEALNAIVDALDNNERMEALDTFADNVLPLYDDVGPEFHDILNALREAASRARDVEPKPISTPFGDLQAKTPTNVLGRIAKIIGDYRYVDPEAALDTLIELYADADSEDGRHAIGEAAKRLAGHDMQVWRHAGPAVQAIVVDKIDRLDEDECRDTLSLITTLLEAVLGTEISGTTSTSDTVTLHRGQVVASKDLTQIRRKATNLLKSLYPLAADDDGRGAVLSALNTAARPPLGTGYGPELVEDLLESVAELVEFEIEVIPEMSWELQQRQESRIVRRARYALQLPTDLAARAAVTDLQARIAAAVATFRKTVDADAEYAIYKVLVGHDVVYLPSWESDHFGYQEEQAYRKKEIEKIITDLAPDNAEAWRQRAIRCASTESNDMATFLMFSHFLEKAGEAKPDVVLGWLESIETPLSNFLPVMLKGLQQSARTDDTRALIWGWLEQGLWLSEIALLERSTDALDESILASVTAKAIEVNDRNTIRTVMQVAEIRFADHPGTMIANVFMPALVQMAANGDTTWLDMGFSNWYYSELIEALDEEQATIVLSAIVRKPKIEHGAAHVVGAISKRRHLCVLDFFGQRDEISASDECPKHYRPFPYMIDDVMRDALAAYPDDVLAATRDWFKRNTDAFKFNGGWFVQRVFHDLDDRFVEKLIACINDGDRDDISFVVTMLNGYEGSERIHPIARAAVAQLEPGDELLNDVRRALEQSGVVEGEYGLVNWHEQQAMKIQTWLQDGSGRVRVFAEEHIRYLNQIIAAETRRAEASNAARRLEYGEDIADD